MRSYENSLEGSFNDLGKSSIVFPKLLNKCYIVFFFWTLVN